VLDRVLFGPDMLPLYGALLRRAATSAAKRVFSPFTIEEAYGLSSAAGVAPFALVHGNRIPEPQAAILGAFFRYLHEPLSGSDRPCPPGPGLQAPWLIRRPWKVCHVPQTW